MKEIEPEVIEHNSRRGFTYDRYGVADVEVKKINTIESGGVKTLPKDAFVTDASDLSAAVHFNTSRGE